MPRPLLDLYHTTFLEITGAMAFINIPMERSCQGEACREKLRGKARHTAKL